ncbi:MAG: EMC3/TMCO1 family protein [Nanoarchaeota archaeon]|nr:EMC3/TMCO1 family protein [Nanoarchaeota archaeon]
MTLTGMVILLEGTVMENPYVSLAVISLVVTLVSTLAQKWLTNQEHMKSLKKRQKEIQKELKNCKEEHILKELNLEMLNLTGIMMKSSMKPMLVTIVPFLILFSWLRGIYGGEEPLVAGWIWYYLGFSVVSSMILRKVLKVH